MGWRESGAVESSLAGEHNFERKNDKSEKLCLVSEHSQRGAASRTQAMTVMNK